jgi:hypothetical protein
VRERQDGKRLDDEDDEDNEWGIIGTVDDAVLKLDGAGCCTTPASKSTFKRR